MPSLTERIVFQASFLRGELLNFGGVTLEGEVDFFSPEKLALRANFLEFKNKHGTLW